MKRLNNLRDIRRYLAGLVNRVETGEIDANLSGKLGYLVSILHRVLLDGDLEERVANLEKQLNNGKGK